ncbi:MAG: outer membrane protein assembly factor BamA [Gemmatimonadaceae bacterium]|nr:outer membrane protein assembly factor BamA [Gemmatimonadaceae bacterium]
MHRSAIALLAVIAAGSPVLAQDAPEGACSKPDSIGVRGNVRVPEAVIRGYAALTPGVQLSFRDVQRSIKAVFATGQYDDVKIVCSQTGGKNVLVVEVKERPVLQSFKVIGVDRVSAKDIKDRLELAVGIPADPAKIAAGIARADSLYESKGYYLARINVDSVISNGQLNITYRVDEGRRLAISGVRINGNKVIPASDIVGVMTIKPEGFLFFRTGEFDDEKYASDLAEHIPQLYGSRGFLDFRILSDSLIVDREHGKAVVDITVSEGPRYSIGSFEVLGNRRFSTGEVNNFYPFGSSSTTTLTQRATGLIRRAYKNPPNTFDQSRWTEGEEKLREAYNDEGYIYAQIRPIVDRAVDAQGRPVVNLRWEIDERTPAIINRIEIAGNDYTTESCIREQIVLAPGQVFNRAFLIRSYQNISNMNFFDSPMLPPETRPVGEQGDVDVIFKVKEKRTGNISFGASMGQGTGIGGFVGLDQPNLLGKCKRAQLQWQFGQYINDFNLTYSDPNIRQTRISGQVSAYHTRSQYQIADLGRSTRTGGQFQLGLPVPNSLYSRLLISYGGEAVRYGNTGLLGTVANSCNNCFRSTLGLTGSHDTRIGLPFPVDGGTQTLVAQFNGGPLGGSAAFQKYTTELRSYAPIASFGAGVVGTGMTVVLGLTARAGTVFGDPGPFRYTQSFSLGGTQYGEPLRGYEEFSITPNGFDPTAGNGQQAKAESFGNAFFAGTAELGLRVSQSLYINSFFDAGNVWNNPREFDPTRLFRGAGFGASIISPLGPLGIDLGYGFDRVDALGRPTPGWKMHFKLGQFF